MSNRRPCARPSISGYIIKLSQNYICPKFEMLSLLLFYSLATRASATTTDNNDDQFSCKDIDNCRTLLSIIWSCVTTIFLCTWVSIHPNIPEPIDITRMSFLRKIILAIRQFISNRLPLFICALLVPEYILAWAIRQSLVARELAKENHVSKVHGFFIIMGGFHYFPDSSIAAGSLHRIKDNSSSIPLLEHPNGTKPVIHAKQQKAHPLDRKQVIAMVESGAITLPTEAEIKDKSKSDGIAKTIVLVQTAWFIIQCIARSIERLPTTELEIITLAYAAVNFGIFIAWWDKPQSVVCPVRVLEAPSRTGNKVAQGWLDMTATFIAGDQDEYTVLYNQRKMPRFYGGDIDGHHAIPADGITLLFGVVFGAIHCIAWSFEFSSHTETLLWRISSAIITGVPVFLFLITAALLWNDGFDIPFLSGASQIIEPLFFSLYLLSGVLYIAGRLATLVLAFMNLSSAPPGVFQAVHWAKLIPHL